jgi:DNA-binding transcriptional MerR regulator
MSGPLQQLDLFGFPIEPITPKIKKEKQVKAPKAEPIPFVAPLTVAEPNIVYEDKSIAIRIKKKTESTKTSTIVETKKPSKRGRKSFRDMDSEVDLIDIPDEETLKKKLYYSISEVAGWFKVNTSLLRYWENEFDVLQPRKTRKGDRLFRVEDIKNLQLIYFLLRQRKFSIEGAKNYLKNNKAQADMQSQLVQSLSKFKSFLLELKANLSAS